MNRSGCQKRPLASCARFAGAASVSAAANGSAAYLARRPGVRRPTSLREALPRTLDGGHPARAAAPRRARRYLVGRSLRPCQPAGAGQPTRLRDNDGGLCKTAAVRGRLAHAKARRVLARERAADAVLARLRKAHALRAEVDGHGRARGHKDALEAEELNGL